MTTLGLASRGSTNALAFTFGDGQSRYTINFALSPTLQTSHLHRRCLERATKTTLQADWLHCLQAHFDQHLSAATIAYEHRDTHQYQNQIMSGPKVYTAGYTDRFTRIPRNKEPSTEAEQAHQGPTFHLFPRLPAEIRLKVWAVALQDQYDECPCYEDLMWMGSTDNTVTIFWVDNHVYVKTDRGYPTLFFVNREARSEAARLDGGAWLPLGAGATELAKFYINFDKEDVYLHDSQHDDAGCESSLLLELMGPILGKEARCWATYGEDDEDDWHLRIFKSHWVGRRRAGETA